MQGSATVHMAAPADKIWNLIVDVSKIGRYSPETFEAEWLDGATAPRSGRDSAATSNEMRSGRCTGQPAG